MPAITEAYDRTLELLPGLSIVLVTGIAATYLSSHYGAPVMLLALLLGMAMNFLSEQQRCCPGINFATRSLLRTGVALLGLRITLAQVQAIGALNLAILGLVVVITIAAGMVIATRLKRSRDFGLLTGGSVAICGASAALAIATVLPGHPDREKQVVFTILTVTVLSTLAMIVYPLIVIALDLDARAAGFFLGGSIHDVAQVIGAGYSVSAATGDFATITKLFRVLLLVPVFLFLAVVFRAERAATGALAFPWFILGFIVCLLLASSSFLPATMTAIGLDLSQWLLVMALAALGMKSDPRVLLRGSGPAIALILGETLLLGALILGWTATGF